LAAMLYYQLVLLHSPDPAKYIPEFLLIATLNLHRQYSRIQTKPATPYGMASRASSSYSSFSR
jgi:hypothetical protein